MSRSPDRKPFRNHLRSMPHVPSAEAETTPPDAVRERHASRSPHREPNREIPRPPSGSFPRETRVSECLSRKTTSGSLPSKPRVPSAQPREQSREHSEHATCPRVPQAGRIPPDVVRECHVSRAVRPPGIPPGSTTFPVKAFPGDHPRHSASTPRVPGVFPSPPISRNIK